MKNYLSPQIMKPVLIIFLSNLMKMWNTRIVIIPDFVISL
jgi:isoprenylcysteine carboxyl methyltransferase (ICMT) family protein YpbQ